MSEKNYFTYGDAETTFAGYAAKINNKVNKVSGKGLSANDYTTDEKTKLAGIEAGADKTTVDTALSSTSENPLQNKVINSALSNKVDKVSGKGLSANDYTTDEKNKLAGIASGAEVNVQSDWSVTTTSSDAYIKNKPTSLPASDVYSWAKASTKPTYTKSEIGLGNVDNTADANKTVNKANTLTTARYIDGISFNGGSNISHFGICSTAAGTTEKAVSVTGTPVLDAGTRIIVRFQYANTASSPTLNVNSLGAKPIKLSNYGSSGSSAGSTTWGAGYVMEFVYANSYWIVVRGENATISYDGLMSAADKTKLNGIATGAQVNSVTGVKGNSESSYRTGNINITKSNIGLGNVDNTADANKPISTATQTALNGKLPHTTITTSGIDFNTLTTTGVYHINASPGANAPTSAWGTLYIDFSTGTPYQIYIPDGANTQIYKRGYTSSAWTDWSAIDTQYIQQGTLMSSSDSLDNIVNANDNTTIWRVADVVANVPRSNTWFDVINFGDGSTQYQNQLAVASSNWGMFLRRKANNAWTEWAAVFDTKNCVVELDTTGTSNNNGTFYNNVIKFPNGLCIQWGRHTNMPNSIGVYFKYAYSYRPSVTFANGQGYAQTGSVMLWFDDYAISNSVDWMAIGYIS